MEEREIAREVLEILPMVMRTVAAELRRTGHLLMPGQYRLLAILSCRSYSLGELAKKQVVSLPTMSKSINSLVERGWVRSERDPNDRRTVVIELTEKGREVLDRIERDAEARVAEMLSRLSPEERRKLRGGLSVLHQAFLPVAEKLP